MLLFPIYPNWYWIWIDIWQSIFISTNHLSADQNIWNVISDQPQFSQQRLWDQVEQLHISCRLNQEMVFQFTSWVCTWLRVGGLWTNWRLKRRTLARSHIHPIQACAQCPANHLLIPRSVFLHMTSLPGTGGSIQRFPRTPPTELNTTECYFRCRRWSANTRSSSSSAHTGFNLQFITMLAMIWWSLILVWWSVRLLY